MKSTWWPVIIASSALAARNLIGLYQPGGDAFSLGLLVLNTSTHRPRVATGIKSVRDRLILLAQGPIRRQAEITLDTIRIRNENYR